MRKLILAGLLASVVAIQTQARFVITNDLSLIMPPTVTKSTASATLRRAALSAVSSATSSSGSSIVQYSYTLQTLSVTDAPTLQWTDSQHVIVNCASNELCYLYYTTNLLTAWQGYSPVTNGEIMPVDPTLDALFLKLEVITNRFYLQILPAPGGESPVAAWIIPEWSMASGYWQPLTNDPATYGSQPIYSIFGNSVVCLQYPTNVQSYASAWPCALIIEVNDTTNGRVSVTNVFYMPGGYAWQEFDAAYFARNGYGRLTSSGGVRANWAPDPCTPSAYVYLVATCCQTSTNNSLTNIPSSFGTNTPPTLPPTTNPPATNSPVAIDPPPTQVIPPAGGPPYLPLINNPWDPPPNTEATDCWSEYGPAAPGTLTYPGIYDNGTVTPYPYPK